MVAVAVKRPFKLKTENGKLKTGITNLVLLLFVIKRSFHAVTEEIKQQPTSTTPPLAKGRWMKNIVFHTEGIKTFGLQKAPISQNFLNPKT